MEKKAGYVDHIIYRNTGNGYTVFELVSEGEEITCVGTFRAPVSYTHLTLPTNSLV